MVQGTGRRLPKPQARVRIALGQRCSRSGLTAAHRADGEGLGGSALKGQVMVALGQLCDPRTDPPAATRRLLERKHLPEQVPEAVCWLLGKDSRRPA
jgi:hypothetical protein